MLRPLSLPAEGGRPYLATVHKHHRPFAVPRVDLDERQRHGGRHVWMVSQVERLLQPRTGSEHVKPSKDLAEPAASHSRQSVADTARPAINATPNKPIRERSRFFPQGLSV